jgi:hypothetical protein
MKKIIFSILMLFAQLFPADYSDNFNRANETPISGNWSTNGSLGVNLSNNYVISDPADYRTMLSYWSANTFSDDQYSQVKIVGSVVASAYYYGPSVRISGAQSFYLAQIRRDYEDLTIVKYINNTPTELATVANTFSANDSIRIEVVGDSITVYVNTSKKIGVRDADISSGFSGVYFRGGYRDTLDDWRGGDVGSSCTPSTITRHSTVIDTIPKLGKIGHTVTGTADSFAIIGSPSVDSIALINKLTKDTIAYRAKVACKKVPVTIRSYSCGSYADAVDTISFIYGDIWLDSANFVDTMGYVGVPDTLTVPGSGFGPDNNASLTATMGDSTVQVISNTNISARIRRPNFPVADTGFYDLTIMAIDTMAVPRDTSYDTILNFYHLKYALPSYTLTVTNDGHGSTTGGGTVDSGVATAITHTAAMGYRFVHWHVLSGTPRFNVDSSTVVCDGDVSIRADFQIVQYTLTMVNTSPAGTISPTAGAHLLDSGATQAISFTPAPGYLKSIWTRSSSNVVFNGDSTTVYLKGDGTVTASQTRITRDTIKSSGLWSTLTWSSGAPPIAGDTVYKVGGPYNDTMNANYTIAAFVCIAGTAGTHWRNGYTLTVTSNLGYVDDGTGTRDMGTGLTANGASGTIHFGSTLGTVTATACVLTMNGTTAMVIDDDKGITAKSLTLGENAVTTNSGAQITWYVNAGTPLTMTNGGTFTLNKDIVISSTTSATIYSLTGSYVINGNSILYLYIDTKNGNVGPNTWTLPSLTMGGTVGLVMQNILANSVYTFNVTGNISVGGVCNILSSAALAQLTVNIPSYNLTCGTMKLGQSTVNSSTCTINFGTGVYTITSMTILNIAYVSGGHFNNFQTSTWTCSGAWTFGSNHTVDPGTSIVNLTGTAAQTITSNGKQFNDLTVNNSGTGTVKFADSLSLLGDLTLTDGRDTCVFISCDDYYNATNDSVFQTDSLKIRGSYYRNNAKIKRTAGVIYFYGTANGTINLVDAGIMGITVINRPGKTVSTFSTTRFSQLRNIGGTFIAANAVTDSIFINLDSAAWQADHTIYLRDSSGTAAKNSYTAGIWRTYGTGADTGKVWCARANKGNIVVNAGAKGWIFNDTVKCLIKKRLAGRVEEKHPMQCTAIIDSCASGDSLITDSSRTITGADANGNSLVRIAGVKVSRGPTMVNRFTGSVDQGVLSNGGAIAPIVCRKTGGTLQFKDAHTITCIIDSAGGLISFADNSTVDSLYTVSVGVKYTVTAGKTLTVTGLNGIGGTSGHPDTLRSGTPGSRATVTKPKDTVPYFFITDIISTNGTYLPATSTSGGNNQHVYSLSYTGVTKDVATGIVGTTVTFTGSGFAGACWVKFGTDSSALTVASYTSASKAVPTLTPGVYAVSVGNGDGDIASVGNFTVTAAGPTITDQPDNARKILGQTNIFLLTATGTGTLHYQWKRNTVNVGTDLTSYTTPTITRSDTNSKYVCLVTDDAGTIASDTAILSVRIYPVIDSIKPIWQKRGAAFKTKGYGFLSTKGTGNLKIGTSNQTQISVWNDTLIIDTIPASWSPKGTYNIIITNSDTLMDTNQLRILIPSITPMTP